MTQDDAENPLTTRLQLVAFLGEQAERIATDMLDPAELPTTRSGWHEKLRSTFFRGAWFAIQHAGEINAIRQSASRTNVTIHSAATGEVNHTAGPDRRSGAIDCSPDADRLADIEKRLAKMERWRGSVIIRHGPGMM